MVQGTCLLGAASGSSSHCATRSRASACSISFQGSGIASCDVSTTAASREDLDLQCTFLPNLRRLDERRSAASTNPFARLLVPAWRRLSRARLCCSLGKANTPALRLSRASRPVVILRRTNPAADGFRWPTRTSTQSAAATSCGPGRAGCAPYGAAVRRRSTAASYRGKAPSQAGEGADACSKTASRLHRRSVGSLQDFTRESAAGHEVFNVVGVSWP